MGASQLVSEPRLQIFVVCPRPKSLGCRTVELVGKLSDCSWERKLELRFELVDDKES